VIPGIEPDDQVILWAGSMLDWQDPQGLVRAVARLARTHPRAKLVFMGTRHPNPDVPLQRAVEESIAVARETGVLDRHVFFNTWVPYAERHEWLLEADLGVSTHRDHLETRLAYRTRMLDYIWSGLPVVCTRGDVFADLVEHRALGVTVPPGDEDALAAALARLLDDEALRRRCTEHLRQLAGQMQWSRVVEPLRRFCATPRYAADRAPGQQAFRTRLETKFRVSKWLKQTALTVGVSEARIEQVKQAEPVRSVLIWRNRLALSRARRGK
jgi:glycosyltransferase involved in cell wall biosynthesis